MGEEEWRMADLIAGLGMLRTMEKLLCDTFLTGAAKLCGPRVLRTVFMTGGHVIGVSGLVELWVMKIKKAYNPLRA